MQNTITKIVLGFCVIALLGFRWSAPPEDRQEDILVKTEVLDGYTVYPSRFFELNVPWTHRLTFYELIIPDALVGKDYRYELWNAANRPIEGAKMLDYKQLSLAILNIKSIEKFRLVVFVPEGSAHPSITDLEPGTVTVQFTESQDNRLLGLIGVLGISLAWLLGASLRRIRSIRFTRSFRALLREPIDSITAQTIPTLTYLWIIIFFASFFGLVVGTFTGGMQMFFVLVKLPILMFGTLAISFMSVVILSNVIGGAMSIRQVLRVALHVLAIVSVVLASVTPVLFHFVVADLHHDPFLILTLLLTGMASVTGMWMLLRTLARQISRAKAAAVSGIWLLVFAVVGLQLGWMMRPWVGLIDDLSGTVPFMRLYSGNVFEALFLTIF